MCNLETEGTKYGCGHYKITRRVAKMDCMSPYCVHSSRHNRNCSDCHCEKHLGPDYKETITLTTLEYCEFCQYWFKDLGAQQRR